MSVKITSFEAENVKRVKAVALEPAQNGLTVIGGRNAQGKTSVLDAISWALGGGRCKPTKPKREGAVSDPYLKVELSNGIIVERKGANSTLRVLDPEGKKSGQALLDEFLETLALNLPKFLHSTDKEKAETLLRIIGVGDELEELDGKSQAIYDQRTAIGQLERQKRGAAEEMTFWPDVPAEPISASELIQEQQTILARNGENQRKRSQVVELEAKYKHLAQRIANYEEGISAKEAELAALKEQLETNRSLLGKIDKDVAIAKKTADQLQDESTEEIERSIASIDATNAKIRENHLRTDAIKEADELKAQYDDLTETLNAVRKQRTDLLANAKLPLPGLGVDEGGVLTFNGQAWDGMSGSEQLKVATAIIRCLKPECGFVLVDKLEQMDTVTLSEFGAWAESEGLQVIGTRVGTGDECSIVIEDGQILSQNETLQAPQPERQTFQPDQKTKATPAQKWSF